MIGNNSHWSSTHFNQILGPIIYPTLWIQYSLPPLFLFSNIDTFSKTLYVRFICTPQYNALSGPQNCRHLGVRQRCLFSFLYWLWWANAKSVLKISLNQISPESKPGKISCTTPSRIHKCGISSVVCPYNTMCTRSSFSIIK